MPSFIIGTVFVCPALFNQQNWYVAQGAFCPTDITFWCTFGGMAHYRVPSTSQDETLTTLDLCQVYVGNVSSLFLPGADFY